MAQIVELTSDVAVQELKGLETLLFFPGGLNYDERRFSEICVSSNNIKVGDKTQYETMAFGNGETIYCERVNTEEEMSTAHFKAVNHFKESYFKQEKH